MVNHYHGKKLSTALKIQDMKKFINLISLSVNIPSNKRVACLICYKIERVIVKTSIKTIKSRKKFSMKYGKDQQSLLSSNAKKMGFRGRLHMKSSKEIKLFKIKIKIF